MLRTAPLDVAPNGGFISKNISCIRPGALLWKRARHMGVPLQPHLCTIGMDAGSVDSFGDFYR